MIEFHEPGGQFTVALHKIHQLHGVIVAVTQIDLGGLRDETGRIMEQRADHIPQGPDEAPHLGQASLVLMQLMDHLAGRLVQQIVLEVFDGVSQILKHRVVVVDDRIEQGIGEIIRLRLAYGSPACTDPLTHRFKNIVVALLLHGDEEIFPKEKAHLLTADRPALVLIDHLRDDEHIVGRVLDLRPLAGVQHILKCQRMDAELLPEESERLNVAKSVDVDPGNLAVVEVACQLREIRDIPLLDPILVILDDPDRRLARFAIDQMRRQRGG